MKLIHPFHFILVGLAILLASCSPGAGEAQPPEIHYGQDTCDACGMIISEARFAAAIVLTNGEGRKFDDISEMFAYPVKHPQEEVKAWFVHDYRSEVWIRGEKAYFVQGEAIKSPMGGGIVAFADEADAQAFASQVGGKMVSFEELRSQISMDM